MSDKTVINNWTCGGTLQTWPDGEWQILYAKDSAGNCVTLSLTSQDAIRLAYAVSPIPNEQFERLRAANEAVYELSYPEARSDELREIANEIDCGGGCEGCSPQKIERGEFCGFVAAGNLRKLAAALDLKAALSKPAPVAANASAEATYRIGRWLSAALEDPNVCAEMKSDINAWMEAGKPNVQPSGNASAEARLREALFVFREFVNVNVTQWVVGAGDHHHPMWGLVSEALGPDRERNRTEAEWRFIQPGQRDVLSAHPHASDCAKEAAAQYRKTVDDTWRMNDKGEVPDSDCVMDGETTKSEGGVQEPPASNPDYNGVKSPAPVTAHGLSGQSCPLNQVMPDPSDRTADVKCEACSGTGRHMGRFSMNDPDCTYCSGKGKVLAGDCDKQGWLAKDVEAATKRVAEWKNETTKSEGGVEGHAAKGREVQAALHAAEARPSRAETVGPEQRQMAGESKSSQVGIESGPSEPRGYPTPGACSCPSDRTADVTGSTSDKEVS